VATEVTAPVHADYSDYPGLIRWVVLVAIMLGTILEVLDISIVNVAIPQMMGNLGATIDQIGWVSTGYIIANVIVLPLTGWLSTRFGRRNYLAFSIILFTTASFFCGNAHSLQELIIFRIFQGVGGAALISTAQATLIEVFPPQQLGMVQGIYSIGVVAAPTLGPTLGGWITDNYSWPWIFFVNIPIGIVAATLTLTFLRDSKYQKRGTGRVDFIGILLLAIGLGCMQTVLEKGNREDWFQSDLIVYLTILSALGLICFIFWELHTDDPAVNLRILKNRSFTAGTLFAAVLGFGLYGGTFVLPIFLQDVRQYTAEQTGLMFLPGGLATMIVAPIIGRSVNKISPRILTGLGVVLFSLSMYLMSGLTGDTGPDQLMFPLILRGAAMGCIFIPLTLATLTGLKGKNLAYGTGLFNLMRQLGGSAGIAFLSTFVDQRSEFHRAVLVQQVTVYNPATVIRMNTLVHALQAKGASLGVAINQAHAILDQIVTGQSAIMAYGDCLLIMAYAFLFALPLLLFFKKGVPDHIKGKMPDVH
jgi:DHA2 family multidrug resistance protein